MFIKIILVLLTVLLSGINVIEPVPEIPKGLGFGVAHQQGDEYAVESVNLLKPDVWANWIYSDACMKDTRCLPQVFSLKDNDVSQKAMKLTKEYPGRLWLLGNEPDIVDMYTYTDPEEAAKFVQIWTDKTDTPYACCGVFIYNPKYNEGKNWKSWMDAYLAANGPIPDFWHIHHYSGGPNYFITELEHFKKWMRDNNVERKIIISETNSGMDYSPDLRWTKQMMIVLDYWLEQDQEVQSILWYSVYDYHGLWPHTNLRNDDGSLTEVGELFIEVHQPETTIEYFIPMIHTGDDD